MTSKSGVCVLGIFVADTAYFAPRLPKIGETLMGSDFAVGPGGKGSNQAVAAARAGANVYFISKIGRDTFGDLALQTYKEAGVTPKVTVMDHNPTGAAFIFVDDNSGDNAIIVFPGAAGTIGVDDVEDNRHAIETSKVFVTQLEQPADAALHALKIARGSGALTVFNPAPAGEFPDAIYAECDLIVPNETEASDLVGFAVSTVEEARKAATVLRERGAAAAIVTMGDKGVYLQSSELDLHVPAYSHGMVVETTGAGDAFLGGLAAALDEGKNLADAVQFGCITAGIAVTRPGTAPAMPRREEIDTAAQALNSTAS